MAGLDGRIGVLGGTFDPPHLGHLILAECAADALDLSAVLFAPAASPPHKVASFVAPAHHRAAMVEAAIAGNPRFRFSRVDMDRPGPHFTVDLLRILAAENPAAALYFILGGDSLRDILNWRDPVGILQQARLAVIRRPGSEVDVSGLEASLPGAEDRCHLIDAPTIGIASTELRAALAAGRSVRYQLPDAVIAYIAAHGLYR